MSDAEKPADHAAEPPAGAEAPKAKTRFDAKAAAGAVVERVRNVKIDREKLRASGDQALAELREAGSAARASLSRARIWRVATKELSGYFTSLAAMMFIAVFLAGALFTFFWVERFFSRNIADIRPLFEWMPILLVFLVSALTMRAWSEERRSGTLEFLLTTPAGPLNLVLGKFLACFLLAAMALALTVPLPITVSLLGPLDWGPVVGGYVATLCLAAAYIAIGLYVSARTDSQIVSLIVTALICGAFYIVGSDAVTQLFGDDTGALLRLFGSGSRFDSITRGVIDLRDLFYYLAIFGVFLTLNLYTLERIRWSTSGRSAKHGQWRLAIGLVIANLIAGNVWLAQVSWARIDLTQGGVYSISEATRSYLRQAEEPLLIRGYFSAETHPLLAPLAPRLQDLLKEYELAGGGRVRVEVIDPASEPELEEEAGRRFGVRPTPLQSATKYQAAVTNSYFDIVVQYGDSFETLTLRDLIELNQSGSELEVDLNNPEYQITRAIKKTLASYRAAGDLFGALPRPVELTGYISGADALPEPLPALRTAFEELIAEYKESSPDKFSGSIVDPASAGGAVAKRLTDQFGLRPLAVGLLDRQEFWFHLVLSDGERLLQLPLPEALDKDSLRRVIEAELKRLAPGALRTVAMHTAPVNPGMPQFGVPPSGLNFRALAQKLGETAKVEMADLANGRTPNDTALLLLIGPEALDEKQLFAVDQFLMRGGSVVIAASAFKPTLTGAVALTPTVTGLEEWLTHHGLTIEKRLVLDRRNTPFPFQVTRNVNGYPVREVQLGAYPHFVDLRGDGLFDGLPIAGLGQLTMTWASPIAISSEKTKDISVTRLLESSSESWDSDSTEINPNFASYPGYGYPPPAETGPRLLGVALEGGFTSFFAGKPSPLAATEEKAGEAAEEKPEGDAEAAEDAAAPPAINAVIEKSPTSARIVLLGSSSFLSDEAMGVVASVTRSESIPAIRLVENTIDWALEDRGLLALRARQSRFSRSLEPMTPASRTFWEGLNYALALVGLLAIYLGRRALRGAATQRRLAILGMKEA